MTLLNQQGFVSHFIGHTLPYATELVVMDIEIQ